jgi:hypothetical protein
MTNTKSNLDLGERIEELVQEHIAGSRKVAQEAVARAFASAARAPIVPAERARRREGKKRASADIAVLGERFYRAVCAQPGETMAVLAEAAGASGRELNRPMTLLRRAGRVRAVGSRQLTRYFPMANAAASA